LSGETIFARGDRVRLTCGAQTVDAFVTLASSNGRSLALSFDGSLDGHPGVMPVLRDVAGVYRSVMSGREVSISRSGNGDA
jgi:hypothetical protein